ncbi:MAG: DUF5077 domain-containing protein [Chitinophagales bacterium]
MKRRSPYLMIATLFCVLFLSSCLKDDAVSPTSQRLGGTGPQAYDPITGLLVPLAGNGYVTKPAPGGTEAITATGLSNWTNKNAVTSTFFHVGGIGELTIAFKAAVPSGTSVIKAFVNGKEYTIKDVTGNTYKNYRITLLNVTKQGYVKVDLQGVSNTNNAVFANVSDIVLFTSTLNPSAISFANNPATYDASRKGAEVRMEYVMPNGATPEWFYNEVAVSVGSDKTGTNFISNGFIGGNAGIQITANGEKRMIFFVSNTPVANAKLIKKGASALEASSSTGKSLYVNFDWSVGTSYKFLTHAKPDGEGNTVYSCWFYTPETDQWNFIGTCGRPNTNNYLTGLYSSLQGTSVENTYLPRKVAYINQWINVNGNWSEMTTAAFKGDDVVAANKQRLDYTASASNYLFSLRNLGFAYDNNLPLNSNLTRMATGNAPTVDLNNLPQ